MKTLHYLLLILGLASCTRTINNKKLATTGEVNGASPYEDSKVQLPFQKSVRSVTNQRGLTPLENPEAYRDLIFVVNDVCLKERKTQRDGGYLVPGYFVDKHLDNTFYAREVGEFQETAIKLPVLLSLSSDELLRLADADPCIMGISKDTKVVTLAQAAGIVEGATVNDHRSFLGADQADIYFNSAAANTKVKIAVIDSGADFNNNDIKNSLSQMEGLFIRSDVKYEMALTALPQDVHGHGTQMASTMVSQGGNGPKGLASNFVEILPIRVEGIENGIESADLSARMLFNSIKRAVNAGAEVINLSLSGFNFYKKDATEEQKRLRYLLCSPLVGYALYRAVERGVVVVTAAGHIGKAVWNPSKNDYDYLPDKVEENLDHKSWAGDQAVYPACWSRYFKGVISVAALDQNNQNIAAFSNWGANSIEIAAPGTGIQSYTIGSKLVTANGTSFSTAMVSAAAALTIAVHKKQGWRYSPWLIEDVLLNGSASLASLTQSEKTVNRAKALNLQGLATYLSMLGTKTQDQRDMEPSDNPEDGLGVDITTLGQATNAETYLSSISLELKSVIASSVFGGRVQFQTVANYANGSYKVVTSQAVYTSSDPSNLKVINGVGYITQNFKGSVTVTASYAGKTSSTPIFIFDGDINTGGGELDQIEEIFFEISKGFNNSDTTRVHPGETYVFAELGKYNWLKVYAKHSDGRLRDISRQASYFFSSRDFTVFSGGSLIWGGSGVYGGSTHEFGVLYRGHSSKIILSVPKWAEPQVSYFWRGQPGQLPIDGTNTTTAKEIDFLNAFNFIELNQVISPIGVLHSQGVEFVEEGKAPLGRNASLMQNILHSWGIESDQKTYLNPTRAMLPGGKRYKAIIYADYRGDGTSQLREYESPWLVYQAANVQSIAFLNPISICPLGTSRLEIVEGYYADGTKLPVEAVVKLVSPLPSNKSGAFKYPFGANSTKNWGAVVYAHPEDVGKTLTFEATLLSNPNLKTQTTCQVEDSGLITPAQYRTIARPVPVTFPMEKSDNPLCATSNSIQGSGTLADPYLVCSPSQLKEAAQLCDSIQCSIKLDTNLDFSDYSKDSQHFPIHFGIGNLDGNGYQIRNLSFVDKETSFVFLTGYAKLKNILFKDIFISASILKLVEANSAENVYLENLIFRAEHAIEPFVVRNINGVHIRNANYAIAAGNGVGLGASYGDNVNISNSSITNLQATCEVKNACSSFSMLGRVGNAIANGIYDSSINFFKSAQSMDLLGTNSKVISNRIERVKYQAAKSSGLFYTGSGGGWGLSFVNKIYPTGPSILKVDNSFIVFNNLIDAELIGETGAAGISVDASGALTESNEIRGSITGTGPSACVGAFSADASLFSPGHYVTNKISQDTLVVSGANKGLLWSCGNPWAFNHNDQIPQTVLNNNNFDMPGVLFPQ